MSGVNKSRIVRFLLIGIILYLIVFILLNAFVFHWTCKHSSRVELSNQQFCLDSGTIEYKCNDCGQIITETTNPIGHDFSVLVSDSATCTNVGTKIYKCSRCDAPETIEKFSAPKGHISGELITLKQATCTELGQKVKKCSVCHEIVYSEDIPLIEHTESEWIKDSDATCIKKGLRHKICSECGTTLKTEEISLVEHIPGEWVVESEPNCTNKGSRYKKCLKCGTKINVEAISALGHSGGEWIVEEDSTCTDKGVKYKICSICSEKIDITQIPAKGHLWGEWKTIKEPYKTVDGEKERACNNCTCVEKSVIEHNKVYDISGTVSVNDFSFSNYHYFSKPYYTQKFDFDEIDILKNNKDKTIVFTIKFDAKRESGSDSVILDIYDTETDDKKKIASNSITITKEYSHHELTFKFKVSDVIKTSKFICQFFPEKDNYAPIGVGGAVDYYFRDIEVIYLIDD